MIFSFLSSSFTLLPIGWPTPTPVEVPRLGKQNPAARTEEAVWRWPASGLEKDERKMLWRLNGLGALLLAVLGKDQRA